MDKNTLTGLVLIGLLLTLFTVFNRPTEEEIKERQKTELEKNNKSKQKVASKESNSDNKSIDASSNAKPDENDKGNVSKNTMPQIDTIIGKYHTISNNNMVVNLNSKGGIINSVFLKKYVTYDEFANSSAPKSLCLFNEGDNINFISFNDGQKNLSTKNLLFITDKKNNNEISFVHQIDSLRSIKQSYKLQNDSYEIDYNIELIGFKDANGNTIQYEWKSNLRKTEKLLSEQRRVSTICFENKNEGFDYLSETSDDDSDLEDDLNWVNYKQSYFSSFLRPEKAFKKSGSKLTIKNFEESDIKYNTHVKSYASSLNIGSIENSSSTHFKFSWYFGPNDYETLTSIENNYEDILNFGGGLFRWINVYAIQPIFTFLINNGISIGIAILLLTIILKLFLMPVQWKMFVSSVKMKILKPEIEEINKKYPKKDDAMKKQMDMMNLYKESGASPLAGCLPMLIQMPILIAVFRFFPTSFELRQKSFLWADDLSSYDSILDLGFSIPLYGDHVSLFTLLMACSTLFYTVMNSSNMAQPQQPGMPNMKVIMYIFPVMMIFFFNNYSSGLSYYYFISTLASILIMIAIKKFFVNEDKLKLKMANRKEKSKTEGPKKSKFQARLEEMQKRQQEQMKKRKK
ncbi:MAG: membrane protein insertase YidC [Crocinitomicaceae bacterium]|nr:membrane protein insertase YidC [Crocinitomicaceae bacterium]